MQMGRRDLKDTENDARQEDLPEVTKWEFGGVVKPWQSRADIIASLGPQIGGICSQGTDLMAWEAVLVMLQHRGLKSPTT